MTQKIITNCDGCVFSQMKRHNLSTKIGTQIGCSLKRHTLLGVNEISEETGTFILERFCNTYRPNEWLELLDFEEAMEPEAVVLEEVFPRIGFFINLDTQNDDGRGSAIRGLEKTIKDITNIDKTEPSYVAVITDKVEYNAELWNILVENFEETETKYHIVQLDSTPKETEVIVDEAFSHAQNGWLYITTSGEGVPSDLASNIHDRININMQQLLLVRPYDGINGMMFPAYLFKFLNGNNPKVFADASSMTGSFIEKLESSDNASDHIIDWEDMNAS